MYVDVVLLLLSFAWNHALGLAVFLGVFLVLAAVYYPPYWLHKHGYYKSGPPWGWGR